MAFGDGQYVTGGLSMKEALSKLKKPELKYKAPKIELMSPEKTQSLLSTEETPKEKGFLSNISDSIGSAYQGKNKSSSLRDAMISLGIPVKNMTKEEKKRKAAMAIEAKDRAKIEAAAEAKRLQRIAQVGTKLSPAQAFVGGGQFGSFGTGIAPGRSKK